jgi:hypothetical protein
MWNQETLLDATQIKALQTEQYGVTEFWRLCGFVDHLCGLVVRVPGYGSWGPGFDSRRYQIFREVVGLERGPLSLVSTIEELLERKRSGFDLESREYGSRDPSRWPRGTLYPQKLALTSKTSGGRYVSTVRSRTQATEFFYVVLLRHVAFVNLTRASIRICLTAFLKHFILSAVGRITI